MTMLKFGGKFDNKAYKTSGGLHGIGVKAVNFLSEWCEVEVRRGGHVYQQEYERGKPTGPVIRVGTAQGTGTKTTFKPDYQIFGDFKFDYNILYKRLQELAFLNRGVKIVFKDLRNGEGETFQYNDGIVEFVELSEPRQRGHPRRRRLHHRRRNEERRSKSRSPSSTAPSTPRTSTPTSTTSTPSTAARTSPASARPSPARSTPTARRRTSSRTSCPPARTSARASRRSSRVRVPEPAVRGADQGQAQQPRGGRRSSTRWSATSWRSISKRIPRRPSDDCQGRAGGRGPRGGPQGQGPLPRPQGHPGRRRPAGQAPRLHQQDRRALRAVPGRGRFGRRQRRGRPRPRVPGHPPLARQDHQRLQVARRQGAGQRGSPQHDLGHRLRHRRRGRSQPSAATARSSS